MLRIEDGKDLPFLLDTGSAVTTLNKSLEPKLGKRIEVVNVQYGWLGKRTSNIYLAPKLYLGNTKLMTGKQIWTDDLGQVPGADTPLMGILGMDCLQHYCLQLNFSSAALSFLDPALLEETNLGQPIPLTVSRGQFFVNENLLGEKRRRTLIDSAEYDDGALSATAFTLGQRNQKVMLRSFGRDREGIFPQGVLAGETYTNLILKDCSLSSNPHMNIIGLRFLARHLVTLNFPKRTMYLRRCQPENLGDWTDSDPAYALTMEADAFLTKLKAAGQLPGFQRGDRGNVSNWTPPENSSETYPMTRTFIAGKDGTSDEFHYVLIKTAQSQPWTLQKAWRTDAAGHIVVIYPVP
jgi:hypothetical protein